jgi:hypothetical protein
MALDVICDVIIQGESKSGKFQKWNALTVAGRDRK